MNLSNLDFFILFVAAFFMVTLLTPLMRHLAIRHKVVDSPNSIHKTHKEPVPYLGGVAILVSITLVTYAALLITRAQSGSILLASNLLIPAIILGVIGLLDDLHNLDPWPRFITQNLTGVVIATILVKTNTAGSPTGSGILDFAISVLWIVGITNAINFFDNLDGGASGTVAISSLFLLLLAIQSGQSLVAALSVVIAGATIAFLFWNRAPARIYMGDAGALFLGALMASLTIRLDTNPINMLATFFVPIFLLAVPILDTSVAVISRLWRGISPFQGGRDHLSHRLLSKNFKKRETAVILWLLTAFFSSFSILISFSEFRFEGFIVLFGVIIWIIMFTWFFLASDE